MDLILKLARWLVQCGADEAAGLGPLGTSGFPLRTSDRDIITPNGRVIASAADPALAEEIAQRLNETEWRRQEDCWAA
jgi:hypothetical protein